jgi:predicted transposase YdaD
MHQHQDYNNIFKENLQEVFIALAARIFNIDISNSQDLPVNLARTYERVPDFLKFILNKKGKRICILHIEIQAKNEGDMPYRMLEYKGILIRQERLPVYQLVIYIGEGKMTMSAKIESHGLSFSYELVNIHEIEAEQFINSTIPEVVLLTILSKFDKVNAENLIHRIITQLRILAPEKLRLRKYIRQLEMLSKLRNLQPLTTKITEAMPFVYDIETDIRFLQGKEKGETFGKEIGKEIVVLNMLKNGLSVEQIIEMASLNRDFVLKIKKKWDAENKK